MGRRRKATHSPRQGLTEQMEQTGHLEVSLYQPRHGRITRFVTKASKAVLLLQVSRPSTSLPPRRARGPRYRSHTDGTRVKSYNPQL
jgi:hypothetical protein